MLRSITHFSCRVHSLMRGLLSIVVISLYVYLIPSVSHAFNPSANSQVRALAVQEDGKVLIGGFFSKVNNISRIRIARLNVDGSLDQTFDPGSGPNSTVYSIAVQTDGKVLIGGFFSKVNGIPRRGIARLNLDGSVDQAFDSGSGVSSVSAIAMQSDGKVLTGGGDSTRRVARLNADGSLDQTFGPVSRTSSHAFYVYGVAVQTDGKVLMAGNFREVNDILRNYIARLNADGSVDQTFNPGSGSNGEIEALALQTDGKVLIGGTFSEVNGISRNGIARLNTDGSVDQMFDPGSGANGNRDRVITLGVQADGKVLMGGLFSEVNGISRNNIARLNADGSVDQTFDPGSGTNSAVFELSVQSDGKVSIGGFFTQFFPQVNGISRNRIARLNPDGSVDGATETCFPIQTANRDAAVICF